MQYDFDFFVIGAGSGGVRAARTAAGFGARVAIAEDLFFGGTCVNVGCVPKKLYVYASEFSEEFEAADGFGWQAENPRHDWNSLLKNKNAEIARLNKIYIKLLQDAGVDIVQGRARLTGPHKLEVAGEVYSAKYILIAVGGWPRKPTFPGAEYCIDSNDFFKLDKTPQRVLVQGGGYVAIEFAGIFHGLGCDTELVYRGDLFLRGFDRDVREFVCREVCKKGLQVNFDCDILSVEKTSEDVLRVELDNGEYREVNAVLSAIGRVPKVDNLGLENTKVSFSSSGNISVDENYRTDEPSIFAVGDVVGRMELTPVALAEGAAVAKYLFASEKVTIDYSKIATAIFCQPNIATVGLSEEAARGKGLDFRVYEADFKPLKNTLSRIDERNYMKVVVNNADDKVIGCHMVGPHAGEIIQGLAVAITAGATKEDFDNTIGVHPTAAEEFVTMRKARD